MSEKSIYHETSKKNKKASKECRLNEKEKDSLPVVGIGASAGGIEAFEIFFTHMPASSSMAFILISHLDPTHTSILPELIKKYTDMSVFLIKDGIKVEADTIYVIPPNKNVAIKNGILYLVEQESPHYSNLPVDYFFKSLADDTRKKTFAVILSGTGSDGSIGLRALKRKGGIVIVQDPNTAQYNGMPVSAINTGLADYILPIEDIPERLIQLLHIDDTQDNKFSHELQQIFVMLRAHTGHDFSSYKLNTIIRRIEKQMAAHHIRVLTDYERYLRLHPNEIDNLFKDLLIGVTNFFRDAEAFGALKRDVIEKDLKKKPNNYCYRVWVPGCSTGEEVYSIAIIIHECMDEMRTYPKVQIFGTDIDINALEIARTGVYPENISHDVNPERLKRYFTKENTFYKIKKEIREMVVFGEQNIIKDPPFTKLDLICCRNLLIYLNANLQKKIIPIFHYSLKPKGTLFLGTSEAIGRFSDLFRLTAKKWKIFERKDAVSSAHNFINFVAVPHLLNQIDTASEQEYSDEISNISLLVRNYLLANYMPSCVVTNKKGNIFYFHGKTGNYLQSVIRSDTLNIFNIVHADLKIELTAAIRKASIQNKEVTYHNLHVKNADNISTINLKVIPILDVESLYGMLLVIFEDVIAKEPLKLSSFKNESIPQLAQKLTRLELELQSTKENLQTTIEELESSNEELQSTNEELQSTNEEIETSKTELQSVNEELIIVNMELQNRVDQLASIHDDMINLFNSTEIAVIFLNNELQIKSFTPKAQDLIHLIKTDAGRSISHFSTNIKYETLIEDAKEVLKTLSQKTIEVQSKDGKWYIIRILPYRTLSNMIDGVVITFIDISARKEFEKKLGVLDDTLKDSQLYNDGILESMHESILILDFSFNVIKANQIFYYTFEISPEKTIGKCIYDLDNKQWDIPKLHKLLEQAITHNQIIEKAEIVHTFSKSGQKTLLINSKVIVASERSDSRIVLAIVDK